jgi:hypothetical protein
MPSSSVKNSARRPVARIHALVPGRESDFISTKIFRLVRLQSLDFTLWVLFKLQRQSSGLMRQPQVSSPEYRSSRFQLLSLVNWLLLHTKKALPFKGGVVH